ncbi:hypothetical protein E2P81_ATG09916 [Venturia nashicola]|uniref:Uncharacterized protein n=1 Tax=Venturia nashicola TaxID=86259 RepID=A0A4Z1NZ69_9PEZI|nr:hypothetical protein E6O75_ATG10133 [Venturia nashicola]TLD15068.1 hypothetical protein E2P81_ATG09916 [Venturia nashicola]
MKPLRSSAVEAVKYLTRREAELEAHLSFIHQISDLSTLYLTNLSPDSSWANATPSTIKPFGIDVGQHDGQLSLHDPFFATADNETGPYRELSGIDRVKIEPDDNSERIELVEEQEVDQTRVTSVTPAGPISMMDAIAGVEFNDRSSSVRQPDSKFGGGATQIQVVLSDKNQQIANQTHLIKDLQQNRDSIMAQLQAYYWKIIFKNRVIFQQDVHVSALQRRIEELERRSG